MAVVERTYLLQVPSSTENLALIRNFLESIAHQAGMEEGEATKIQLAVDEACANVIEHAYGNDATKEVMVRVSFDEEILKIEVVDTGRGFDQGAHQPQELEDLVSQRKTGGLGLRLIKSLMDEVQYDMEPGVRNQIRMTKRIGKRS